MEIEKIIRQNFLFADCEQALIQKIIERAHICEFLPHERLALPDKSKSLGIILEGKALVTKQNLVMRILQSGDMFGVASLFVENEFDVSEITAKTATKVMFLPEELLKEMLREDFRLAEKYISFLANRICYLNHRLDECTGSSNHDKLASYILNAACAQNSLYPVISLNMTQLSASLNMSRASLYRALDTLENKGVITKESGKITVKNIEELAKLIK